MERENCQGVFVWALSHPSSGAAGDPGSRPDKSIGVRIEESWSPLEAESMVGGTKLVHRKVIADVESASAFVLKPLARNREAHASLGVVSLDNAFALIEGHPPLIEGHPPDVGSASALVLKHLARNQRGSRLAKTIA